MTLTIELLKEKSSELGSTEAIINFAKSFYGELPKRNFKKPMLPSNSNSSEVLIFADELKKYEDLEEVFKEEERKYYDNKHDVDVIIENFIKDYSGLYDIPKQYQDKVYSVAYEKGSSYGFYSVYQELISLVYIFS